MVFPQTGANILMKCVTREKPSFTFVLVCTKKGKEVFLVILL